MCRLMTDLHSHFVAMETAALTRRINNNKNVRCRFVLILIKETSLYQYYQIVHVCFRSMWTKKTQKTADLRKITSFPSMPRRKACLWCHNKYIYGYREEFLPPLLHCNNRGRGRTGGKEKAFSLSLSVHLQHFDTEPPKKKTPTRVKARRQARLKENQPNRTEPAPLRKKGIKPAQMSADFSPSQAVDEGFLQDDKTF